MRVSEVSVMAGFCSESSALTRAIVGVDGTPAAVKASTPRTMVMQIAKHTSEVSPYDLSC